MNSKMRLQKFLAQSGIGSRRQCEDYIKQGRVQVNDQITTQMGVLIDPSNDIIKFHGNIVKPTEHHIYYLLNKPAGFTTTVKDPHAKKTILELIPIEPRVFPVGRLDKDSRGLIILTNDGNLANILTHPRYEHNKEYSVIGSITAPTDDRHQIITNIKKLEKGIILDGKSTLPTKIDYINVLPQKNHVTFQITVREGRNRQIRRMCDMIGIKVINLQRIRIGKLTIGDLKEGQYRTLELQDIL